jgi:hypothetical protein
MALNSSLGVFFGILYCRFWFYVALLDGLTAVIFWIFYNVIAAAI